MNALECFLEVAQFNTSVTVPKWELGYWGEVIDDWYQQGLPMHNYPKVAYYREKLNRMWEPVG